MQRKPAPGRVSAGVAGLLFRVIAARFLCVGRRGARPLCPAPLRALCHATETTGGRCRGIKNAASTPLSPNRSTLWLRGFDTIGPHWRLLLRKGVTFRLAAGGPSRFSKKIGIPVGRLSIPVLFPNKTYGGDFCL